MWCEFGEDNRRRLSSAIGQCQRRAAGRRIRTCTGGRRLFGQGLDRTRSDPTAWTKPSGASAPDLHASPPERIGSAAAIVRKTGATTYMHPIDAPIAETGGPFRRMGPAPGLHGPEHLATSGKNERDPACQINLVAYR